MRTEQLIGVLLVLLGVFLFVVLQTGVGGEAIPLFIGLGFLIGYGVTRNYGMLVPAGILTGLGTGIVVAAAGGPGPSTVLGLGLGFVSIYVIDRLTSTGGPTEAAWWPLVPGGILTAVGVVTLPAVRWLVPYALPVGVILAGLALLVLGRRRPPTR